MGDIVPGVPCVVRLSPNHGDARKDTLGVFLHSTHGPALRRAGESLDDWYAREYAEAVAFMLKTEAQGNTNQVSPTFCVGPRQVTRMVADDLDPWCQRYPANDLYLAIELAKPAAAAVAKLPFLDFQYAAAADLIARWKVKYPKVAIQRVRKIGVAGLIGHRDVQAGKLDPDDSFDWPRLEREALAAFTALTAPKPATDPAYDLVGSGLKAWLLAHRETVGKPRFRSRFDEWQNELVWCAPSAAYPDGPLVVWRNWAANERVDPVAIATWKGRLP